MTAEPSVVATAAVVAGETASGIDEAGAKLPVDSAFRAFRRFNDPQLRELSGLRRRLGHRARPYFEGDGLPDQLARALCDEQALPIKELFESFEVFERIRRRLRAPTIVDLCCGHGLTGALFAIFVPEVERVVLVDQHKPQSHDRIMRAIAAVAPWAPAKVRYDERRIKQVARDVPRGASVVALHACGARTDRSMELAITCEGSMALVPCCYFGTAARAPAALRHALGPRLATDVDRTYRLERAGYRVEWSAIPRAITEMNRLLVARRRS